VNNSNRYESDRPAPILSSFRCFPNLETFSPSLPCNSVRRDHEVISSILRRYLKHASSMLKLPASMAAKTMVFLLATQRTVLEGGRVTSAQCQFPVETATFFSACLDTLLLHDLERDDDRRVPPETFTTVKLYFLCANEWQADTACQTGGFAGIRRDQLEAAGSSLHQLHR
jgi:hypothetical protein